MSIDWSKAPEGATHWDTGLPGRVAGWMRLDGDTWYWWPVDGAKCDRKWFATGTTQPVESFIERPTQWSGEGLPPVGTVCEMRRTDYVDVDWQKIVFLCAGDKKAFFRDRDGHEWSRPLEDLKFRPIRTPEQIAAEEREKAINEMRRIAYPDSVQLCDLGRLYDAGWRKQVKP